MMNDSLALTERIKDWRQEYRLENLHLYERKRYFETERIYIQYKLKQFYESLDRMVGG